MTMTNFQLTEKVPLTKALYINEFSFKDFKAIPNRCKNDDKRRICYEILVKYTSDVITNNGDVVREYNYSKNMKTSGRLFSNGVQNVGREMRGFLMSHTTDIPSFSDTFAKNTIYAPPNWTTTSKIGTNTTKDEAKTMFFVAFNSNKINKHSSHPIFRTRANSYRKP
jgi:hypothetical protein